MSSPAPNPALPPRRADGNTGLTALWSVALAGLVIAGMYWLGGSSSPETKPTAASADAPSSTARPGPPAVPGGSPPSPAPDPEAVARQAREGEKKRLDEESARAALTARLTQLQADGESAAEALAQLDRLAGVWKAKYEPLRSDEVGQRIAASPTHLVLAITALARDRAGVNQHVSWKTQRLQLLTPVELAARSAAVPAVTDDTLGAMTKLHTTIRAAVKEWESDMAVLEAAKIATALLPPGPTLSVAWEWKLATERVEELNAVESARLTAQREKTERLKQAERVRVEAEAKADEVVILAKAKDAEFRKKQAEAVLQKAEDQRKAELAKAQLLIEYERDLPAIKATLPAFITSGKSYRQKASNGPLSLAYLQGVGALKTEKQGMREFSRIARQDNDRPAGPIPLYDGSEWSWQNLDKDAVKKAQGFIIKYGAILVEKGLLDP